MGQDYRHPLTFTAIVAEVFLFAKVNHHVCVKSLSGSRKKPGKVLCESVKGQGKLTFWVINFDSHCSHWNCFSVPHLVMLWILNNESKRDPSSHHQSTTTELQRHSLQSILWFELRSTVSADCILSILPAVHTFHVCQQFVFLVHWKCRRTTATGEFLQPKKPVQSKCLGLPFPKNPYRVHVLLVCPDFRLRFKNRVAYAAHALFRYMTDGVLPQRSRIFECLGTLLY